MALLVKNCVIFFIYENVLICARVEMLWKSRKFTVMKNDVKDGDGREAKKNC